MKKKYYAPEMEEVKIDEVVVLDAVIEPEKAPIAEECDEDGEA